MTIRERIEKNPFVYVFSIVIMVSSAVAGVVGWFYSNEISDIKRVCEFDLKRVRIEQEKEIGDLRNRLLTVERRMGSDKLYLDVMNLQVVRGEIRSLSAGFRPFSGGLFYVDVPKAGGWQYRYTSQYEFAKMMAGDRVDDELGKAKDALSVNNTHVWYVDSGDEYFVFGIKFLPCVMVVDVDKNYLSRLANAFGAIHGGDKNDEEVDSAYGVAENQNVLSSVQIDKQSEPSHEVENKKLSLVTSIENSFDKDLLTFAVLEGVLKYWQLALGTGGSFRVLSVEKKGNVVYVRTRISLYDKKPNGRIYLDEEMFLFSKGESGVMVRIMIPSRDDRNDSVFSWTQSWLIGLRVLID